MPEFPALLIALITATGLAGLIGLEREIQSQKPSEKGSEGEACSLGGLRTYGMMGAIGFLGGFFSQEMGSSLASGVLLIFCCVLVLVAYVRLQFSISTVSITDPLSLLASLGIGLLVAYHAADLAVAISILFTGLLVLEIHLHSIAQKITPKELLDILKFLILSVVLLPLLPLEWIDPMGLFDWRPRIIWLMVILIASLRFVGYFLSKFFGAERSLLLSGVIGGFVSSTAVTMSVSEQSREKREMTPFLIPIFLASALMFFRVILEIRITAHADLELFWKTLLPLLAGGIVFLGAALAVFLHRRQRRHSNPHIHTPIHIEQPLRMKSALSFGAFFLLTLFLSEKIATFLPDSALLAVGALTGITDVDSITLSMAEVQKNGEISATLASQVILTAVLVNTLVKAGIVFLFGSRKLFRGVSISILIALLVSSGIILLG